jgi:hypothetical protein
MRMLPSATLVSTMTAVSWAAGRRGVGSSVASGKISGPRARMPASPASAAGDGAGQREHARLLAGDDDRAQPDAVATLALLLDVAVEQHVGVEVAADGGHATGRLVDAVREELHLHEVLLGVRGEVVGDRGARAELVGQGAGQPGGALLRAGVAGVAGFDAEDGDPRTVGRRQRRGQRRDQTENNGQTQAHVGSIRCPSIRWRPSIS